MQTGSSTCSNVTKSTNWSEIVQGEDADMKCRQKCFEQVKKFGDGCCEVRTDPKILKTQCLFRSKSIPMKGGTHTRAIECKGKM